MKKSIEKIFDRKKLIKKIFDPKNFWSKKKFGRKNFPTEKKILIEKIFFSKIFDLGVKIEKKPHIETFWNFFYHTDLVVFSQKNIGFAYVRDLQISERNCWT